MQLFFRPLPLTNVYYDGHEKPGCAFRGTRNKANTDIPPNQTAVLAPVTSLNSPVSPPPFQAFEHPCFGSRTVFFRGQFENGETLELFLRIAEHFLPS